MIRKRVDVLHHIPLHTQVNVIWLSKVIKNRTTLERKLGIERVYIGFILKNEKQILQTWLSSKGKRRAHEYEVIDRIMLEWVARKMQISQRRIPTSQIMKQVTIIQRQLGVYTYSIGAHILWKAEKNPIILNRIGEPCSLDTLDILNAICSDMHETTVIKFTNRLLRLRDYKRQIKATTNEQESDENEAFNQSLPSPTTTNEQELDENEAFNQSFRSPMDLKIISTNANNKKMETFDADQLDKEAEENNVSVRSEDYSLCLTDTKGFVTSDENIRKHSDDTTMTLKFNEIKIEMETTNADLHEKETEERNVHERNETVGQFSPSLPDTKSVEASDETNKTFCIKVEKEIETFDADIPEKDPEEINSYVCNDVFNVYQDPEKEVPQPFCAKNKINDVIPLENYKEFKSDTVKDVPDSTEESAKDEVLRPEVLDLLAEIEQEIQDNDIEGVSRYSPLVINNSMTDSVKDLSSSSSSETLMDDGYLQNENNTGLKLETTDSIEELVQKYQRYKRQQQNLQILKKKFSHNDINQIDDTIDEILNKDDTIETIEDMEFPSTNENVKYLNYDTDNVRAVFKEWSRENIANDDNVYQQDECLEDTITELKKTQSITENYQCDGFTSKLAQSVQENYSSTECGFEKDSINFRINVEDSNIHDDKAYNIEEDNLEISSKTGQNVGSSTRLNENPEIDVNKPDINHVKNVQQTKKLGICNNLDITDITSDEEDLNKTVTSKLYLNKIYMLNDIDQAYETSNSVTTCTVEKSHITPCKRRKVTTAKDQNQRDDMDDMESIPKNTMPTTKCVQDQTESHYLPNDNNRTLSSQTAINFQKCEAINLSSDEEDYHNSENGNDKERKRNIENCLPDCLEYGVENNTTSAGITIEAPYIHDDTICRAQKNNLNISTKKSYNLIEIVNAKRERLSRKIKMRKKAVDQKSMKKTTAPKHSGDKDECINVTDTSSDEEDLDTNIFDKLHLNKKFKLNEMEQAHETPECLTPCTVQNADTEICKRKKFTTTKSQNQRDIGMESMPKNTTSILKCLMEQTEESHYLQNDSGTLSQSVIQNQEREAVILSPHEDDFENDDDNEIITLLEVVSDEEDATTTDTNEEEDCILTDSPLYLNQNLPDDIMQIPDKDIHLQVPANLLDTNCIDSTAKPIPSPIQLNDEESLQSTMSNNTSTTTRNVTNSGKLKTSWDASLYLNELRNFLVKRNDYEAFNLVINLEMAFLKPKQYNNDDEHDV